MVVFMICGPCLGWHGPKVARRAFGPCWAVVSGLRPSTARPGKIPCLIGPARFSPKHDGSVPCRPGTAQLSALAEPDGTMRANSISMATTAAFLIMDSEELLLLLFPELYVLDFSFGSDSIAATKSHDLDSSRLL